MAAKKYVVSLLVEIDADSVEEAESIAEDDLLVVEDFTGRVMKCEVQDVFEV